MKLAFAVIACCLALGVPLIARAAEPQPLSIRVYGDNAEAAWLPSYDPHRPIAVSVTTAPGQPIDGLEIVATAPSGLEQRVALTRTAPETFAASFAASEPGSWSLRLVSRSGALRTGTTPVAIAVAEPPPSNAPLVGFGVGATVFLVFGGGGFLALRRLLREPAGPPNELSAAA